MSKVFAWIGFCVLHLCGIGFSGNAVDLRLKTEPDAFHLEWTLGKLKPDQWQLVYNVIGTGYHSTITVNGSMTSATINTTDYPGMMYAVHLYGVTNGEKSYIGTHYGRSGCTKVFNATIGNTFTVISNGYPTYQQRGAICNWIFNGSDVTWYRIDVIDVNLNVNESKCNNYLQMSEWKLCGNATSNRTYHVTEPNVLLKHVTTKNHGERGFKINITAIHMTDAPYNVRAYINGEMVNVTWNKPVHHPVNFSYLLRTYNKQQKTSTDVTIPSNKTFYLMNYRALAGQTFVFKVLATSGGIDSNFSSSVEVKTSCDRRIHVKPTDSVEITSNRYPFRYLQGISCHYQINTDGVFILRIMTSDIDISGGNRCENTYVRLGDAGQFCAMSPPDRDIVIKNSSVDVFFRTNGTSHGKGFNITISSVSKPPSAPTDLSSKISSGSIRISWKLPIVNQPYVDGYKVEYFILPDTAGGLINVLRDVINVSIPTSEHPGRLYTIRVAAFTGGGQGPFSRPLFARSACGSKHHLTRKQSAEISTETFLQNGEYQSGTICQWNIMTDPLLWLKIDVETLDIEMAPNCSKDYLRVGNDLVLCGQINSKTFLIERNSIDVIFSSDFNNTGKGFKLALTAIGPKPGVPRQLAATAMQYGIFVTWNKPEFLFDFVSGYIIHNHFRDGMRNFTVRVDKNDNSCILDMTSFPGRLVEVWLQAVGDMINSNSSSTTVIRNECGAMYNATKMTEPLYLSSPYQNSVVTGDVFCKWSIVIDQSTRYRIHFIKYSVNNGDHCDNVLIINANTTVCNGSVEGSGLDFTLVPQITIEMNVTDGGYLSFVISVRAIPHISDRSSKTERITSSSAPVYSTSFPVLITSLLVTFVASSTSEVKTPDELDSKEKLGETTRLSNFDSYNLMPTTELQTLITDSRTGKVNAPSHFPSQTVDKTQRNAELNSDSTAITPGSTELPYNVGSLRSPSSFTNTKSSLHPSFRSAVCTELTENVATISLNPLFGCNQFEISPSTLHTTESVLSTACIEHLASEFDEDDKHEDIMTHSTSIKQESVTEPRPVDKVISDVISGRPKCRNYSFIQAVVTTFGSPSGDIVTSSLESGFQEVTINATSSFKQTTDFHEYGNEIPPVHLFDRLLTSTEDKPCLNANSNTDKGLYSSSQSSSVSSVTDSDSLGDKQRETTYRIPYNAGLPNDAPIRFIFLIPLSVILYL